MLFRLKSFSKRTAKQCTEAAELEFIREPHKICAFTCQVTVISSGNDSDGVARNKSSGAPNSSCLLPTAKSTPMYFEESENIRHLCRYDKLTVSGGSIFTALPVKLRINMSVPNLSFVGLPTNMSAGSPLKSQLDWQPISEHARGTQGTP